MLGINRRTNFKVKDITSDFKNHFARGLYFNKTAEMKMSVELILVKVTSSVTLKCSVVKV